MNAAAINEHSASQSSNMSLSNAFITVLPWSSSEIENKRFKTIVIVVLCITLLFAGVVKWQELPERTRAEKEKIPPQLTRLITAKKIEPVKVMPKPKPIPLPLVPKIEKPKPIPAKPVKPKKSPAKQVKDPVKAPAEIKEPTQAQITEQAKKKARQSGLLAFQDDLASMRDHASLNNLADTDTIKGGGTDKQTQRKFIGKKVIGNSGGVNTSQLTTDIGARGQLKSRKTTEYVAANEGLVSLAAKQIVIEGTVLGNRDTESIRKVLDANKSAIYAIYRKALRADPSLQGKVTVNLQIEANGSVSKVKLIFSELGSPSIENKLLNRIRLINFGEQQVTQTLLDYSFNFLPF